MTSYCPSWKALLSSEGIIVSTTLPPISMNPASKTRLRLIHSLLLLEISLQRSSSCTGYWQNPRALLLWFYSAGDLLASGGGNKPWTLARHASALPTSVFYLQLPSYNFFTFLSIPNAYLKIKHILRHSITSRYLKEKFYLPGFYQDVTSVLIS